MGVSRALPLALGGLAVSSGAAMMTFDIVFAVTLSHYSQLNAKLTAIIASAVGGVAVALLLLLMGRQFRQFRHHNGAYVQEFGHGRWHTYLLAGLAGIFGILAAVASALLLVLMRNKVGYLPKRIINSSTEALIAGGFAVWGFSLLSQVLFVICIVAVQRKDFQRKIQPYYAEPQQEMFPQMQDKDKTAVEPPSQIVQQPADQRRQTSMESRTPPSSSGRSRDRSDTMSSLRSSLSQVVRPITSKTRLIQAGHRSPHGPPSIASTHCDASIDGFDSWDTSTVDAQSRQAVESASPTPQRFLETIPASPTGSRSPSPGFPLDLELPKSRMRSQSYSPAHSPVERPRNTGVTSSSESLNEAHIHPLFRTDSPTPPPAATPGTIVTASPNAGQVISDRQSIRSLHRMRSGSLPSSPLAHSSSLDSIRRAMEREELERLAEAGGERSLTPPIPDFIINGGPRNNLSGYNSRKKSQTGLGVVGEGGEG